MNNYSTTALPSAEWPERYEKNIGTGGKGEGKNVKCKSMYKDLFDFVVEKLK